MSGYTLPRFRWRKLSVSVFCETPSPSTLRFSMRIKDIETWILGSSECQNPQPRPFCIWIDKESVRPLILAFLGLPVNLAHETLKTRALDVVDAMIGKLDHFFSTLQIISVVAGSIRIRHFLGSGYLSAKIANLYKYWISTDPSYLEQPSVCVRKNQPYFSGN